MSLLDTLLRNSNKTQGKISKMLSVEDYDSFNDNLLNLKIFVYIELKLHRFEDRKIFSHASFLSFYSM
jgi:hypothetical protein